MKNISKRFLFKLLAVTVAGIVVMNFSLFTGMASKIINVLQPVFIGIVAALILNVPTEFFERKLFCRIKREKPKRFLATALSLVLFAGVLALVFGLALPAAFESVKSVYSNADGSYWSKLATESRLLGFLIEQIRVIYTDFVAKLNDYFPKMLELATDVVKAVANFVLGLGVALMILTSKHNLKAQAKKLLFCLFKDKGRIKKLVSVGDIALEKFSRYLGGQIIEAVILGIACYLCMLLLKLPYAALISLVIGFVNLIPIIGAYVGGGLGAILIFSVSPPKALIFVVFIMILQEVESFTTYPVIVGKYVGLNGFWIMVSIIVWGGLFGFWGVFLGVPLTAFCHDFVNMYFKEKNAVLRLPAPKGGTDI